MTSLGQKFITVAGHSDLTAKFQKLCGIKKLDKVPVVNNGVSKDSQIPGKNGFLAGNGFMFNAIRSWSDSPSDELVSKNGHVCNGTTHLTNGLNETNEIHRRNGFKSHEQVNGYKNGYVNGSTNGYVAMPHQNGHCAHSSHIPNGIDKNIQQKSCPNGNIGSHKEELHRDSDVTNSDSQETQKYTIENSLLFYIFTFGAGLGNEIFYIMFFTFSIWNFDSFVVRKCSIMWIVVMYIGQAAKDVIRWPRPHSPPVVRMEERYVLEYGMPSTHAMVGVAIPFGMLIFMSGRYEFNLVLGLMFAITWSILVSFSRLYLGMHSVLDLLAGIFFASLLMAITAPFVDTIDTFLISHPNSLPVMVGSCIALCLLYPSLDKWSSARGDTTLSLAVFSGIYAGLWMTGALTDFQPEKDTPPFVLGLPTLSVAGYSLLRQVLGVIFLVTLLTVLKVIILKGLCCLFGYDPKDPNTKKHLHIELPYRYVSYFVSSLAAVYIMPLIFLKLNIARDSFYSEVFNY